MDAGLGPPRDIPGDAFEARVRAFLQGRFWELLSPSLDITLAPIRAHEHPETPHDNTALRGGLMGALRGGLMTRRR